MSILKDKSETNFEAATYLIDDRGYHCSSIHCCYYSCLQKAKHILIEKYTEPKGTKYKKGHFDKVNSTHRIVKDSVFDLFDKKGEKNKALNFITGMGKLQRKRNEADYTFVEIDEKSSKQALTKATELLEILDEL